MITPNHITSIQLSNQSFHKSFNETMYTMNTINTYSLISAALLRFINDNIRIINIQNQVNTLNVQKS